MKNYPVLRLLHAAEERADEETTIRDYTSAEELLAAEREPAVIIVDTSRLHEGEERTCYKTYWRCGRVRYFATHRSSLQIHCVVSISLRTVFQTI